MYDSRQVILGGTFFHNYEHFSSTPVLAVSRQLSAIGFGGSSFGCAARFV
jgi:hypothetical protein